jgi:hypothetical protein
MVREANILSVVPVLAVDLDADDLVQDLEDRKESTERGRAKRVFWRAVLGTRKIVLRAQQTGRPDLRQAKRLVQPVVDNIMRHETRSGSRDAHHDEYTRLRECERAVDRHGPAPRQLVGLADLRRALHDIGKIAVREECCATGQAHQR